MAREPLEGWSSNEFKPILDDDSSSSSSSDSDSDESDDEELQAPRGISGTCKFKKIVIEEELLPE
jgi:hypothetical protein